MSSAGRGPRRGGADDFFATSAWCVDRLMEAWKPAPGLWLEPSAGNGAIVKSVNFHVSYVNWRIVEVRDEEHDGLVQLGTTWIGDFLDVDSLLAGINCYRKDVSVIVGNPPYAHAIEFIKVCRNVFPGAETCLLLRLNFLGSEERAEFFRTDAPDVFCLPNRPSFTPDGKTDSTEYAWFRWPANERRSTGVLRMLATTPLRIRRPQTRRAA